MASNPAPGATVPAAQAPVTKTTLNHPTLPQNISLIERITLPTVFALVMNLMKNDAQRANLQGFFEPIRDALNQAYPIDNSAGGEGTAF